MSMYGEMPEPNEVIDTLNLRRDIACQEIRSWMNANELFVGREFQITTIEKKFFRWDLGDFTVAVELSWETGTDEDDEEYYTPVDPSYNDYNRIVINKKLPSGRHEMVAKVDVDHEDNSSGSLSVLDPKLALHVCSLLAEFTNSEESEQSEEELVARVELARRLASNLAELLAYNPNAGTVVPIKKVGAMQNIAMDAGVSLLDAYASSYLQQQRLFELRLTKETLRVWSGAKDYDDEYHFLDYTGFHWTKWGSRDNLWVNVFEETNSTTVTGEIDGRKYDVRAHGDNHFDFAQDELDAYAFIIDLIIKFRTLQTQGPSFN